MSINATHPFAALVLAGLVTAQAASAQQAGSEGAADSTLGLDLEMGEPAEESAEGELGQPYILEVSGDWEIRCVRTGLEADPCALYQLLNDQDGNSVATIEVVNLPDGAQAAAGATIVTPLETLLTRQITLSVDGGAGKRYPFNFCTTAGCVARVGFTEAEVNAFRRGAEAILTIVPAGAPETEVDLSVSLMGFTAGYTRITELNAANAEAIRAARAESGDAAPE
jgi:invasion protein IalB